MTTEKCPTCKGKCCADKYDVRGPHVPVDDPFDDSFIYWDHACEDCVNGSKFVHQRTAEQERAAVVAWLRECALDPEATGAEMRLLQEHATRIERGEHVEEKP
jgi:hypothetical protein